MLFELSDPQGRLKPGMFADIGLGTDLRDTVMVTADGVLHVGRAGLFLVGMSWALAGYRGHSR